IGPLPLFLSFTQSWWFWSFGSRVATEAYSNATDLMWSLSTEAFFYLAYVPLAQFFRRLFGGPLLIAGTVIAAAAAGLTSAAIAYRAELDALAVFYVSEQTGGQFTHWLVFNSPWIRLPEFLLGALAAQYLMTRGLAPRQARMLCGGSLALLVVAYLSTN